MIALIIVLVLAVLVAVGIAVISGDEPQESKESKIEMDNSEFDWGHNVKHRTEDDYE